MSIRSSEIEEKWRERWYSARINEAEIDGRPKFMIIFAYPGVTGYLHIGHMRGFTYVDSIARYKRLEGYNVMFPVGTHATGNGAISLAARIARKDQRTIDYLCGNTCPVDMLDKLTDPVKVVEFFNDVYVNQYWKRFGFLCDWRRFTSTVNPDYQKFIEWQFRKLMQKGLLIQKPYYAPACIAHGPVAIDASETDIQCGGCAETVEYTLLKFKCGDMYLVAATLRPETVFGQTNFWVNPEADYVKAKVGTEVWVISESAYTKLTYQMDGMERMEAVKGKDLIGLKCIAPMIHREILTLPADFCDPNVGTGLVTSVPSDSPDDWISLRALQNDEATLRKFDLNVEEVKAIKPIAIIEMKGWSSLPAVEVTERMGILAPGDPKLEEAKKLVYKDGFHTGRMNETSGEYAGLSVMDAKERMKQAMLATGEAAAMYDLSEAVICRCGEPVVIKKVNDQWFIDYANLETTIASKEQAKHMDIFPAEYYQNIHGVLDWFRERACVRQGNWIGTRFPFDDKWIIEAISDSTLYPLYYTISKYANEKQVVPAQMTEEFFDLLLLGKGDFSKVSSSTGVPEALLRKMRDEVLYWYPLDLNLGGKEHMTVHFPAFLMNHVAILPKEMWPRGIFVNWWVIGKGGKISKSKGWRPAHTGSGRAVRGRRPAPLLCSYRIAVRRCGMGQRSDGKLHGQDGTHGTGPVGPHVGGRSAERGRWLARLPHGQPRAAHQGHDEDAGPAIDGQRGLFRGVQRPALVPEARGLPRPDHKAGDGHAHPVDDADNAAHCRGTVGDVWAYRHGIGRIVPADAPKRARCLEGEGRGLSACPDGRCQRDIEGHGH